MNKNQKGIARHYTISGLAHLFLLVIVILVAIGAVGYLAYQNAQLKKQAGDTTTTPESTEQQVGEPTESPETADWKTYTNTEYGFSLRYPDYLQEYEYPEPYYSFHNLAPKSLIISFATDDLELGKDGPIAGTVQGGFMYRIYIEPLSTPDFVSNRCKVIGGFNTIKECEQISINEYPAVNGLYTHQEDEFVFIEKDSQVYELEMDFSPKINTQIYKNLFDQILSTFRFFEKTYPEWKMYINEDINFYFEYPPNWELTEEYHHQRGLSKYSDLLYISIRPTTMKEDSFWLLRVLNDMDINEVIQDTIKENPMYPETKKETVSIKDAFFATLPVKEFNHKETIKDQNTGQIMKTYNFSEILLEKDGYVFILPAPSSKNDPTLNQILSTFKFTK